MSWFRVCDTFYDHPKVVALRATQTGRDAIALWVLAASWAAKQGTNGSVSKSIPRAFGFTPKHIRALIGARLWLETADGWRFHDWPKYQGTTKDLDHTRALTRQRVTRYRERQRNALHTPLPGSNSNSNSKPNNPPLSPPGVPSERFAEVYRGATGLTDLSPDSSQWTTRQRDAVSRMRRWAEQDPARLHAELKRLIADPWLARQPIHIWAGRLGTGEVAQALRRAPAAVSAAQDFEQEDDPEWLTGESKNGRARQ